MKNEEQNTIYQVLRPYVSDIIKAVVVSIVAFAVIKADLVSLDKRVEAIEDGKADRDVVEVQLQRIEQKVDDLRETTKLLDQKFDKYFIMEK